MSPPLGELPRQRASEIFCCIAWNGGMVPARRPSATANRDPRRRLFVGMKKKGSVVGTWLPPGVTSQAMARPPRMR